nr:hypothetical protein [uncultured Halomonas sp.]
MRKEDINNELKDLTFDFFYWFSRFEFALKESKYLKRDGIGDNAEPGWFKFIDQHKQAFQHTDETRNLLALNPKRQKVSENAGLEWKDVGLDDCDSELCKVVRLLKTTRNNLFHGGKHGAEGWDDPERTKELLVVGKSILDRLAELADFEAHYKQYY